MKKPPVEAALRSECDRSGQLASYSPVGMPVWILRSSGWIVRRVGSEASDFGGSFSIVNTNAALARAKASPNSFSFRMMSSPCLRGSPFTRSGRAEGLEQAVAYQPVDQVLVQSM